MESFLRYKFGGLTAVYLGGSYMEGINFGILWYFFAVKGTIYLASVHCLVKQGMIYYAALAMAFGGVQYTLYNLFCEMNYGKVSFFINLP